LWGLNVEVGEVSHALDIDPWNAELRAIVGGPSGLWLPAANSNVDIVISGPRPGPVTLDVDAKVSYRVGDRTRLGLETSSGLGALSRLGNLRNECQSIDGVIDTTIGKWDLDVGLEKRILPFAGRLWS
jgi:hypothetical protein